MSNIPPFSPGAVNATLAVTTVAGGASVALGGAGAQVRIANTTTVEAFAALGTSSVTVAAGGSKTSADDGGFSLPGSSITILTLPPGATTLAAITGASTTVLRINRGDGA